MTSYYINNNPDYNSQISDEQHDLQKIYLKLADIINNPHKQINVQVSQKISVSQLKNIFDMFVSDKYYMVKTENDNLKFQLETLSNKIQPKQKQNSSTEPDTAAFQTSKSNLLQISSKNYINTQISSLDDVVNYQNFMSQVQNSSNIEEVKQLYSDLNLQLIQVKQTKKLLQDQFYSANQKVEELGNQLNQTVTSSQQYISLLQQNDQLCNELSNLKQNYKNIQNENNTYRQKHNQYDYMVNQLESQVQQQLNAKKEQFQKTQQQLQLVTEENKQLIDQNCNLQLQIQQSQSNQVINNQQLSDQLIEIQMQNQQFKIENEQQTTNLNDINQQLNTAQDQLQQKTNENSQLQQQLTIEQQNSMLLQQQIPELKIKYENCLKEVQQLTKLKNEQFIQIQTLKSNIESERGVLLQNSQISTVQNKNNNLERQLNQQQKCNEQLQQEMQSIQHSLQQSLSNSQNANSQLNSANYEIQSIQQKYDQKISEVQNLSQQIDQLQIQIDILKKNNQQTQEKNNLLQNQYTSKNQQFDQNNYDLVEQQQQYQKYKQLVAEMKAEYLQLLQMNDEICDGYERTVKQQKQSIRQYSEKLALYGSGDTKKMLDQLDALNNIVVKQNQVQEQLKNEKMQMQALMERKELQINEYRRLLGSKNVSQQSLVRINEMMEQIQMLQQNLKNVNKQNDESLNLSGNSIRTSSHGIQRQSSRLKQQLVTDVQ